MRMLRVSKWEIKSAEKAVSSRSTAIIADFSRRMTKDSVTAAASGQVERLTGEAPLAEEIADAENGEDRLLALSGQYFRALDLALLDVEDSALAGPPGQEDDGCSGQLNPSFTGPDLGQKHPGIERRLSATFHECSPSREARPGPTLSETRP